MQFFLKGNIGNAATCWQSLSVRQSTWSVIPVHQEYYIHMESDCILGTLGINIASALKELLISAETVSKHI